MRNLLALSVFAFLSVFAVSGYASDFSVSFPKIPEIYAGSTGEFNITIENPGSEDWFGLSVLGTKPEWIRFEDSAIRIPFGKSSGIKAFVSPSRDAYPMTYVYNVIATRSSDNKKQEKELKISVSQNFSAIIKDYALSCTSCMPGDKISVTGDVMNVGIGILTNLNLDFKVGTQKKDIPISKLSSREEKSISVDFPFDKYEASGSYNIKIELAQEGKVLDAKTSSFSVQKISNVVYDAKETKNIFGRTVVLKAANEGNAKDQAEMKSSVTNQWWSAFTGPQPQEKTGDEYTWKVSLAPGEQTLISFSEVYWPVPAVLIIILACGAFLYFQMAFLSVRKKITQKHLAVEGRDFPTSVYVKNRGNFLENVVVKDFIPSVFTLSEKFETLKPTIRKTEAGIELTWKLGRLKPHEERVLHYRIKTVLGIIGSIVIPGAEVRARFKDRVNVYRSNSVRVIGKAR